MNCALRAEDIVILLCQLPFVLNTIISGFRDEEELDTSDVILFYDPKML